MAMTIHRRDSKLRNTFLKPLHFSLLLFGGIFLLLLSIPASTAEAQNVDRTSEGITSLSIKVSYISPAAGVSYRINNKSELRALGSVTIYSNLSRHDNQVFLDLSYLRYTDWIGNQSFNTYWGLDLNMLAAAPLFGPGLLLGSSYYLESRFALFAEVGANVFIDGNGNSTVGLDNSGIGLKVHF
jgi:hypothetical protein